MATYVAGLRRAIEPDRPPRVTGPLSPPTDATVRTVALEYSTDDGATWTKATVVGSGATWTARVNNPEVGFVSLRASVTDSAGDSHSMSVIRAYGVR